MQRNSLASSLAFVAALAATQTPGSAQQGLQDRVSHYLRLADAGSLDGVWALGRKIGAIEGQEDALAQAILSATAKLGPKGRLAGARALLEVADGTAFGERILKALLPVTKSQDSATRAAAIGLLGNADLFNRRTLRQVRALLEENTTSELTDAPVRVAAAKALWKVGDEQQRVKARDALRLFLKSKDHSLRVRGALALAEINTDSSSPAFGTLREIADEPTIEGRLARSYLQRETQQRQFEKILRTLSSARPSAVAGKEDPFATLREIMSRVRAFHIRGKEITDRYMLDHAAKGLASSLDRHSAYFTSDEYQRFFFDLNREYGGIGAYVNFDQDQVFSIVRPIYSGPAYRVGLRSGDRILEVDGWETRGHTSDEIIAKLKGKPGTPVAVKVLRLGMQEPKELSIVRQEIHVPSVNYELLPGKIGYVELITFGATTASELRKALSDLKSKGIIGLVVDLRNNTGGYLEAARNVVEEFVAGKKMVVYTKSRAGREETYYTRDRALMPDVPLVVLINRFSASASEITAGALQFHKRAKLVGKRSFGKGSVQHLMPLRSQPREPFADENHNGIRDNWESYEDINHNGKYDAGPHLKLTIARYYLPNGHTPNKEFDQEGKLVNTDWGIMPDVEAEVRHVTPKEAWKNGALFDLVSKGVFRNYVRERLEQNKTLFQKLAQGDTGDYSQYPDFEEFYNSLDTKLSRDDIRRWLRYEIRDQVADLRGKAFAGLRALGDHEEDGQLQEAVRMLLARIGKNIFDLPAYKSVLKIAKAK